MKNVLLLVHDDEGQEARLQVALDVTRALAGHLTCLGVAPSPMIIADLDPGSAEAVVVAEACERERQHLQRLEARLAHEDVPWNAVEVVGDPARKLREAAGLADLIVVSSGAGGFGSAEARRIAAELAVTSRRPVLAVPQKVRGLDLASPILIAWDGTAEANAALRAAVPLLREARDVALLEIDLPEGTFAAEEGATYLSRHGVSARIVERHGHGSIAETILEEARSQKAGLIVMGAYGHGRALDALFGGVSGEMLVRSEIPLLLAH